MPQAHDRTQVGKPATDSLRSEPFSARGEILKIQQQQRDEAQAICDAHNSDPTSVGVMSHGFAWKGYGMAISIPVNPRAVHPTIEDILATERQPKDDASK